jgi:hypothetical protein
MGRKGRLRTGLLLLRLQGISNCRSLARLAPNPIDAVYISFRSF